MGFKIFYYVAIKIDCDLLLFHFYIRVSVLVAFLAEFYNLKGAGFLRLLQVCVLKHIPQLLSIIYYKRAKYASA